MFSSLFNFRLFTFNTLCSTHAENLKAGKNRKINKKINKSADYKQRIEESIKSMTFDVVNF